MTKINLFSKLKTRLLHPPQYNDKPPLAPVKRLKPGNLFPPSLEAVSSYDTDTSTESYDLRRRQEEQRNMDNRNRRVVEASSMASADKEMEERAKRAKELLSMRYRGLRNEQVSFRVMRVFLVDFPDKLLTFFRPSQFYLMLRFRRQNSHEKCNLKKK